MFAVGVAVIEAFRQAVREVAEADWCPLLRGVNGRLVATGQEYAEVCCVPKWVAGEKDGPVYRFLAFGSPWISSLWPGMEALLSLPFPTMDQAAATFKVTGIVENLDLPVSTAVRKG